MPDALSVARRAKGPEHHTRVELCSGSGTLTKLRAAPTTELGRASPLAAPANPKQHSRSHPHSLLSAQSCTALRAHRTVGTRDQEQLAEPAAEGQSVPERGTAMDFHKAAVKAPEPRQQHRLFWRPLLAAVTVAVTLLGVYEWWRCAYCNPVRSTVLARRDASCRSPGHVGLPACWRDAGMPALTRSSQGRSYRMLLKQADNAGPTCCSLATSL